MENKQKLKEYSFNVKSNVGWYLCPQEGKIIGHKQCAKCKYNGGIVLSDRIDADLLNVKVTCLHPNANHDYSSPYKEWFYDLSGVNVGDTLFSSRHGEVKVFEMDIGEDGNMYVVVEVPRVDKRMGVVIERDVFDSTNGKEITTHYTVKECNVGTDDDADCDYTWYRTDGRINETDIHPSLFKSAEQHFKYWMAVNKRDKENER